MSSVLELNSSEVTNDMVRLDRVKSLNRIRNRMHRAKNKDRILLRQHIENLIAGGYCINTIRRELTYLKKHLENKSA
jgi:hypothetical protein